MARAGGFVHGEHNQLIGKLATPAPKFVEVRLRIELLQDSLRPFGPVSSLYLTPNIPDKKLRNARKFREVPDEEEVLALLDCTVFGSASDSVLFGNRHLFSATSSRAKRSPRTDRLSRPCAHGDSSGRRRRADVWRQPDFQHFGVGLTAADFFSDSRSAKRLKFL